MNLGQWGWVKVLGRLGTLWLGGKNLQLLTLCTFPAQMAGRSGRVSLSLFDVQILESAYFPRTIHCPSIDSTSPTQIPRPSSTCTSGNSKLELDKQHSIYFYRFNLNIYLLRSPMAKDDRRMSKLPTLSWVPLRHWLKRRGKSGDTWASIPPKCVLICKSKLLSGSAEKD